MRDVDVFLDSLHSALALGPVAQDHLLQARQMQALSFTAHIPLVCFGIAFPVMVLLMEWWGQRTGDPLCRTIARRWSNTRAAHPHLDDRLRPMSLVYCPEPWKHDG